MKKNLTKKCAEAVYVVALAVFLMFAACSNPAARAPDGGNLERLAPGTIDTSFNAPAAGFCMDPQAIGLVHSIAVQQSGGVLIGGAFPWFHNAGDGFFARLSSDGSLDTSFPIYGSGGLVGLTVASIEIESDGEIIVGGCYDYYGNVEGEIWRLNSDGSRNAAYSTNPTSWCKTRPSAVAAQGDGKILFGGSYTDQSGEDHGSGLMVRLNTDFAQDSSFNGSGLGTGTDGWVRSIVVQNDGKILIGGHFSIYNGVSVGHVARLNTDGSLDTTFSATSSGIDEDVYTIAIQSDGKILIGWGVSKQYSGVYHGHLTRLNADGTLDTTFNASGAGPDGVADSILPQSDGKILIGGEFSTYNGVSVGHVSRLKTDGTLDPGFDASGLVVDNVYMIAVQGDGKILVADGSVHRLWN
jgi:uncharacterized delta-60 repeat protein